MIERETEIITLPRTKAAVTVKSWLTGGELIDLEATTAGAGAKSVNNHSGEVMMDAESAYRKRLQKLISIMITKIQIGENVIEEKTKIWETVCDLPHLDYNTLMMRIDGITVSGGSLTEDEKKA